MRLTEVLRERDRLREEEKALRERIARLETLLFEAREAINQTFDKELLNRIKKELKRDG